MDTAMRRLMLTGVLGTLAVAVLLCGVGVWGAGRLLTAMMGTQPRYDLAALSSQPEASLVAPNSTKLHDFSTQRGGGSIMLAGSPNPARHARAYGTQGASQEVIDYYQRELQARGWQPYAGENGAWCAVGDQASTWRKGDFLFRVTLHSRDPVRGDGSPHQYPTFYDTCLTERYPL